MESTSSIEDLLAKVCFGFSVGCVGFCQYMGWEFSVGFAFIYVVYCS